MTGIRIQRPHEDRDTCGECHVTTEEGVHLRATEPISPSSQPPEQEGGPSCFQGDWPPDTRP